MGSKREAIGRQVGEKLKSRGQGAKSTQGGKQGTSGRQVKNHMAQSTQSGKQVGDNQNHEAQVNLLGEKLKNKNNDLAIFRTNQPINFGDTILNLCACKWRK